MLESARPDHTKPTVAFIGVALAAALVLAAGTTDRSGDVVAAGDARTGIAPPVVVQRPEADPVGVGSEPFSIADVVTLDELPEPKRAERARPPAEGASTNAGSGATTSTTRPSAGPTTGSGSGSGGSGGSGGSSGSGGSAGSSGGSAGSGSGGGSGSTSSGPGRSETGRGKARGQRDSTPGKRRRASHGQRR